jgi:hypothetical protein
MVKRHKAGRLKIRPSNVEALKLKQLVTCSKCRTVPTEHYFLFVRSSKESSGVLSKLRILDDFWGCIFWVPLPFDPFDPFLLAELHGPAVDLVSTSSELSVPPSWVTVCLMTSPIKDHH